MFSSFKKIRNTIAVSALVALLPLLTLAQEVSTDPSAGKGGGLSYSLQNPLKIDSLEELIVTILEIVIVLATPIVVLFIIFAGFQYVTARGNASKVEEATRALTYAVIGGVLIIGAVAIAQIIKNLVLAF